MPALGPPKVERRCFLFLSAVFAVIDFSVGADSLVIADQELFYFNQLIAPYGIIDISIHDVLTTGTVTTTICAVLAIVSGIFCAFTWHPIKHQASSFGIQSWTLFLCAAWLSATLVTYNYFFASRPP